MTSSPNSNPAAFLSAVALTGLGVAAAKAPPLRAYRVSIKRGQQVLREFEAMAPDSCAAVMQHADLLADGEKLDVCALADVFGTPQFFEAADAGYQQQKDAGFPDRYSRQLDEQQQRLSNLGRL